MDVTFTLTLIEIFVLFSSVARGNEIPSALIVGVNVCKHVKNYSDYTALTTLVP